MAQDRGYGQAFVFVRLGMGYRDLIMTALVRASLGCVFFVILVSAASCGEAAPCVVCPDIAGVYEVEGSRPSSTCDFDFPFDLSGRMTVQQDESWVRIVEIDLEGTLRDDGSVYFPRKELASFRDERFMLSLTAVFEESEEGNMNLRAYATVTYTGDNCSIRSSVRGTRI